MKVFFKVCVYPVRKNSQCKKSSDCSHKAELSSLVLSCTLLLGVDYIQRHFQQHVNHKQHKFWHNLSWQLL